MSNMNNSFTSVRFGPFLPLGQNSLRDPQSENQDIAPMIMPQTDNIVHGAWWSVVLGLGIAIGSRSCKISSVPHRSRLARILESVDLSVDFDY